MTTESCRTLSCLLATWLHAWNRQDARGRAGLPGTSCAGRVLPELVGGDITYADEEWVSLRDGDTVLLSFQLAPDYQPPTWPEPGRPPTVPPRRHGRGVPARRGGAQGARAGSRKHELQPGGNWGCTSTPSATCSASAGTDHPPKVTTGRPPSPQRQVRACGGVAREWNQAHAGGGDSWPGAGPCPRARRRRSWCRRWALRRCRGGGRTPCHTRRGQSTRTGSLEFSDRLYCSRADQSQRTLPSIQHA